MSKRSALDSPADSPARDAGKSRGPGWPRDEDRRDEGRWADRGVAPRTDNRTGWVVVADEALARILVSDDETPGALRPERALTDPKAHAKEGELDHERGRRSGVVSSEGGQPTGRNAGGGASLVASAGEENVHLEAKSFARRVAEQLAEACREQRFDELTIIAAPRFLGLLRKELDASVRERVVCELDKDLIHESEADIAARLRALPPR